MDRLTSMAVFVKAVDLGSFAAAAGALDLSGPMVGKHIRFLEERLGGRLLNRTTRRQSLTELGWTYYERCRVVLAEAEAAEAVATDQLLEPRGRLRVTMPVHFGRHCAAPVLLAFAQRYPALNLDLSFNDRVVDLAEDGYDLAIRTGELQDRAGVTVRRVARQRMVVCASPAYLDRNGRPAQLEDIAGHQGVLYWRSGAVAPWQFPRPGQPPAEVTPLARFRFDDLDAIADAAAAGLGLAWLPSWLIRERLLSGTLVTLLTDLPEFPYDSYALWLSTPRLPLKIRLAIDSLATGLPRLMDRE